MIRLPSALARRARLYVAALPFALAAALPQPASADAVTEGALRSLLTAVDASPDWSATMQAISSDASGAGVLTGLHVESAVAGMTIDIDRLTVTRGSAGSDGRYAATKVVAGSVTIAGGPLSVTLANVTLDDFVSPAGVAFAFDPEKPFSSIARGYSAIAKTHIGQAKVGALAMTEKLANTSSRVTYNDLTMTRLDGGKIASLSAGPLTTESPVADQTNPKPLVAISIGKAEARDLDLAAMLRVYEAVPAGAARNWQAAVANATYRDAVIRVAPRDAPVKGALPYSIEIKLGTISMDDFKVRPGATSVADDLDHAILSPFEDNTTGDPTGLLNILSAYAIGKLTVTPIDFNASGLEKIHLDGLSISNMSTDGIGEMAFTGLSAPLQDVGTLKAGRIAFGGVVLPKSDVYAASVKAALSSADPDFSSILPVVGFVELGQIDVNITSPPLPPQHLGKLRLDFGNHLGNVPTSFKIGISEAQLDAALMPDPLRPLLSRYGYSKLLTDVAGTIAWNEQRKQTTLTGVKLTVKDVGTLAIDATLNGPSRADFEALTSLSALPSFADKLALVNGTVSFKDDSITGRVLNDQAVQTKTDPERFRNQLALGLPFMLLPVGSTDFQRKATPVFQEFIRTPGTVTFSAAPAMPVGLKALIEAAQSSQLFNLPTLLNVNVTGVAGPKPATPAPGPGAPAPAPVVPAAPTPAPGGTGDIRGTVPAPK